MKFDTDTEIDRLLRRHARRKGTAASSTTEVEGEIRSKDESAAGGAHLDADEMNAFAEGALPDASRARYFAHLADCDECRGLVTQLTLAANVAAAPSEQAAIVAASPARSWREWLSALFAPPVLRFAVPALALLAVMVVFFVATRERREANLVAQNEQAQSKSATTPSSNYSHDEQAVPTTATTDTEVAQNKGAAPNTNSNTNFRTERETDAFASATPQQQKKEGFTEQESPARQSEPKPAGRPDQIGLFGGRAKDDGDFLRAEKPAEPPPPPVANVPATKAPVDDERAAGEESARKTADTNEKNKASAPSTTTASTGFYSADGSAQVNGQRAPESSKRDGPAARRGRSTDNQLSKVATPGADAKEDRGAETRSVGGRQFRRQGGAWVDTAYSPARAIVSVTRGSEQYRALVADEPGIRTIADQLNGTVIIVWKSRAYRIY